MPQLTRLHTGETRPSVATLYPGYFAMVMATGIVAIAASQHGLRWLANGLLAIAAASWAVLSLLLVVRIIRYWSRFVADVTDHAKGFAFLTAVAGTNILGSTVGMVHGWWGLAWGSWWLGLALWVTFTYVTLVAVVILPGKPGLELGINGTWFLLTVAVQSIVVLGTQLVPFHPSVALVFVLLSCFALGITLYLIVMTMIFLRWTFVKLEPAEVDPPVWIAAGAVAITVLAGSNILLIVPSSPLLERMEPFVAGVVILAWATATFWFPLMVAIGLWRHEVRRLPLRYHPSYWSLVFPIGMYSAATFEMRKALALGVLGWLPVLALGAALLAWTLTFLGLVHRLITGRKVDDRLTRAA